MIYNLLIKISQLLQTELAGLITQPAKHILALPITESQAESLPLIGIYPGNLEISQNFKHSNSSQPSLQELHQEIIVDSPQPSVTYQLDKTPVKNTILCHLVIEQQSLLQEDTDFSIDYQQGTITFNKEFSQGSKILLRYSFLGIAVMREFTQDFFIDIVDTNLANIEQFSSLASGAILTSSDELIVNYNFNSQITKYQTNQVITNHTISRISFINGTYTNLSATFKFQLKFQVIGQLNISRTVKESAIPIQTIQIYS